MVMSRGQRDLAFVGAVVVGLVVLSQPDASESAAAPSGPQASTAAVTPPVPSGRLSSGFGSRWGTRHNGIDIAAPQGTPIRAVSDGTVIKAGPASGFGLWVQVRHANGDVSVYGHMHTITTRVGARVRAGQQIATVGSRGQSTGPHLHLEIWPGGDRSRVVDPKRGFADRRTPLVTGASR